MTNNNKTEENKKKKSNLQLTPPKHFASTHRDMCNPFHCDNMNKSELPSSTLANQPLHLCSSLTKFLVIGAILLG